MLVGETVSSNKTLHLQDLPRLQLTRHPAAPINYQPGWTNWSAMSMPVA